MAKFSFLTNFSLLLHSVIGAVVKENLSEDFLPHVSLLSSDKPFPLDEHLDGAVQFPRTSTNFISTLYQNLLDGHSLPRAVQTRSNLRDVNTVRTIAPTGDLRTAVFTIPALQPKEDVHHVELRFNSITTRGRWLEIKIKQSSKTIRSHLYCVSNNNDITAILRLWMSKNKKLHVEIKQTINSEGNGLLLIYSNDKTHLSKLSAISNVSAEIENGHSRSRRSTHLSKLSAISNVSTEIENGHSRSRRSTRQRRRKDCHLSNMYINFSHLGWGQYILFPTTFNAKVCKGICPARVAEEKAVTNHARLQSLLRQSVNGKVPLPCCVPTILGSLSMLYREDDQIIVKYHKDMVARECGCE